MAELVIKKSEPIARAEAPCPCGELVHPRYVGFPISPEIPELTPEDMGTSSSEAPSCQIYPS